VSGLLTIIQVSKFDDEFLVVRHCAAEGPAKRFTFKGPGALIRALTSPSLCVPMERALTVIDRLAVSNPVEFRVVR
jgi:hypothetical protein